MRAVADWPGGLPAVPRLGIATRGNTTLEVEDVEFALERGVRYFNWCGHPDGLSRAIAQMGSLRTEVIVATQLKARSADEARRELDRILRETGSERLEIGTLYYVESNEEWQAIAAPGGAWEALEERRLEGQLGLIGLTSHQRALAAGWARETTSDGKRRLDMLMVRYNAAHTGAERDVFPVTKELGMPVVTFTGLRWRDLLQATPEDPPGSRPPSAADCYRFCLAHPDVAVALAAPDGRAELEQALGVLEESESPEEAWIAGMREHGARVHRHARKFW